jgi:hypothetical protein
MQIPKPNPSFPPFSRVRTPLFGKEGRGEILKESVFIEIGCQAAFRFF